MKKVYIVGAKRSPIGSFLGTLAPLSAAELGSQVLTKLLKEAKIPVTVIDEVIIGNVLPAGQKQGVARQVSIHSGIPNEIPAYGINMVCGSGMKAVMNGYTSIMAGFHHLVVAGGVESMSNAPYLVSGANRIGVKMGEQSLKDHMMTDALLDAFDDTHMGMTAERVATKHNLTREMLDRFSISSQEKAIKAIDSNRFKDEIIPITIKTRRGDIVLENDEYVNRATSYEKLAGLRTAFDKSGVVTAGSSSGLNDGASFVIIADEEMVKKHKLTPLVEIIAIGQGGVDPQVMGLGPVPAINNALKMANLKLEEIDLLELNEAFAAQSLGVVTELSQIHKLKMETILSKTNLNGGAIAIGHPLGASGNRIIVTLVHELMKHDNFKYGLASLCIGGGMGTAIIVKKI